MLAEDAKSFRLSVRIKTVLLDKTANFRDDFRPAVLGKEKERRADKAVRNFERFLISDRD